jgi:hypothetical protein
MQLGPEKDVRQLSQKPVANIQTDGTAPFFPMMHNWKTNEDEYQNEGD